MVGPAMTLQIPISLYDRLQSLAAAQNTDPVKVIERLVDTGLSLVNETIITDPHLRGGRPVLAGSGITVRTIAGYYKMGLTPEEIADQIELDLALVYAAIAYYHLHQAEIEADILANSEQAIMSELGVSSRA